MNSIPIVLFNVFLIVGSVVAILWIRKKVPTGEQDG